MSGTRRVLLAAARDFNSRRFFEAHEVLEDGLEEVEAADWDLILGLIQVAVGYHKASQGLWSGSLLMLGKGLEKMAPYPAVAASLHLDELRQRLRADVERIRAGDFEAVDLAGHPPRFTFAVESEKPTA